MADPITTICDPEIYRLNQAVQKARNCAQGKPGFEVNLVRFLQAQCLSRSVNLPIVFRGLEVLGEILNEGRLVTLLRPFLRSSDPHIASKCVLVLGRRSRSMNWLYNIMGEADERIRANLIEALWKRKEPEVEMLLRGALEDSHPRVAANAVYGLYLLGIDVWAQGLERLTLNENPAFRKAAVWVVKASGIADAPGRLKHLIKDPNPGVRRAAFNALIHLRDNGSKRNDAVGKSEHSGET